MGRFIEFLFDNPLILIILGGWLLSSLGRLGAKAARTAAAEQQKQAQQAREQRRAQQPTVTPTQTQARTPPAAREAPKPEDIAAEIRRMMGLEEAPPTIEPEPVAAPEPPLDLPSPDPRRGELSRRSRSSSTRPI